MISTEDTIVAIATPLGEGGLGVVRLSGSQSFAIADRVFQSKQKLSEAPTHTIHHGWITDVGAGLRAGPNGTIPAVDVMSGGRGGPPLRTDQSNGFVDEAVAAVFRAPRSYTGEDVLEISCHGSPVVLKEVVRLCVQEGARPAQPGEFTQRAYLNGKLDLPQAEAVADLIHAQSSKARAAAAEQLRGQLSVRINGLREQIVDLLAHIEANLDFAEEEIPIIERDKMKTSLDKTILGLDELLSTSVKGRLLRDGLKVTLAGRPNVGKSSLFNALLAQDRAIVTDVPGTTRDTLEEKMEWDGFPVVLIDTAGLRSTDDAVESEGTARATRAHANADVIVFVVDGSVPFTDEDTRVSASLQGKTVVTALNKADRGCVVKIPSAVATSAKDGRGLSELKSAILASVVTRAPESEASLVVTNLRHARHLEAARDKLKAAKQSAAERRSEETVALDLRAALEELGEITGEAVTEDVLSAIFRQFCIGK